MQTLHPVLKRGGLYWDKELLPQAVFEDRLKDIRDAIEESGDDAWVIYGDAQRYGNVAYVSHFLPRTRSALVLVPREGPPTLLASVGARDVPATKTLTWVDDVRPFSRLPGEAIRLLTERGLGQARVGLVGTNDSLPVAEWTAIREELPAIQWHDRDEVLRRLRTSKHETELAAIKRTSGLVQAGLKVAGELLRPDQSMRKVAAQIDREIRRRGAEDVRLLVASGGQAGRSLRPPDDRVLAAGDAVLIFVAAEAQRYWAEGAQTYVLGSATEELRGLATKASEALGAMASSARAGAKVAAVASAARQHLGQGDLWTSANAYGFGHGIGLDLEEAPAITPEGTDSLENGATLGLHVVLHSGPTGAISGTTVSVHAEGSSPLLNPAPLVECQAHS